MSKKVAENPLRTIAKRAELAPRKSPYSEKLAKGFAVLLYVGATEQT